MKSSLAVAMIAMMGTLWVATPAQNRGPSLGVRFRSAKERHAELKRALKSLEKSREDLMKASRDYGGHRTKAVEAIDNAIAEVKQALAYGN